MVGGDEFLALAPIAADDQFWSGGPDLDEPCELDPERPPKGLALTQTCAPVAMVQATRTIVDPGVEVGSRTVEYSAPDTDTDDIVRWTTAGGFPGVQALLGDPFAQADESRRAFVALVLSGAVSFALLFVERLLFHRWNAETTERRPRRA